MKEHFTYWFDFFFDLAMLFTTIGMCIGFKLFEYVHKFRDKKIKEIENDRI